MTDTATGYAACRLTCDFCQEPIQEGSEMAEVFHREYVDVWWVHVGCADEMAENGVAA